MRRQGEKVDYEGKDRIECRGSFTSKNDRRKGNGRSNQLMIDT